MLYRLSRFRLLRIDKVSCLLQVAFIEHGSRLMYGNGNEFSGYEGTTLV